MKDDPSFLGLLPPAPPPGLRESALGAGYAAFAARRLEDPWARTWRSPALRLAWAASVAVLVTAHVFFSAGRSRPAPERPRVTDPEIVALTHLPRIDTLSLPDEPTPTGRGGRS